MEKRYIGATDEPLCGQGAAALRPLDESGVELVIVTPLRRTVQTAQILFPQIPTLVCEDLREMDFGLFEGKNYRDLAEDAAYRAWVETGCETPCPQGEDRAGFIRRCCRGFEASLALLEARSVKKAAFVVHGGTLMSVLSSYARPAAPYFSWQTPNGGIWRAVAERGTQPVLQITESPMEDR